MKKLIALLILSGLSLTTLAGSALPSEQTGSTNDHRIELPQEIYTLSMSDLDEILGRYEMENGKTLVISDYGRRIYAELEGLPKVQVVAATPNLLVAKNRKMKLAFQQLPNGAVAGVTVTYIASTNNVATTEFAGFRLR